MRTPADPILDRRSLLPHVATESFWRGPIVDAPSIARSVRSSPSGANSVVPAGQVMTARTAQRFYGDAPVPQWSVDMALEEARKCEQALFGALGTPQLDLEYLVVANRVEQAERTFWLSTAAGREELGPLPPQHELAELVLQVEYSWAPVTIMALGPLDLALAQFGPVGHRHLLIRAGAATHAAWLSVVSHGLVGSIFAGLLATPLRSIAGVDGYTRLGLLAFAFGQPAPPHGLS